MHIVGKYKILSSVVQAFIKAKRSKINKANSPTFNIKETLKSSQIVSNILFSPKEPNIFINNKDKKGNIENKDLDAACITNLLLSKEFRSNKIKGICSSFY